MIYGSLVKHEKAVEIEASVLETIANSTTKITEDKGYVATTAGDCPCPCPKFVVAPAYVVFSPIFK